MILEVGSLGPCRKVREVAGGHGLQQRRSLLPLLRAGARRPFVFLAAGSLRTSTRTEIGACLAGYLQGECSYRLKEESEEETQRW
jgi:hypothetical protein